MPRKQGGKSEESSSESSGGSPERRVGQVGRFRKSGRMGDLAERGRPADSQPSQPSFRPRTQATRSAFTEFLARIDKAFPDQPEKVLRAVAEMALGVLRDRKVSDTQARDKLKEVMAVDDELFEALKALAGEVKDFEPNEANTDPYATNRDIELDPLDDERDDGNDEVDSPPEVAEEFFDVEGLRGRLAAEISGDSEDLVQSILTALAQKSAAAAQNQLLELTDKLSFELAAEIFANRHKIFQSARLAASDPAKVPSILAELKLSPEAAELAPLIRRYEAKLAGHFDPSTPQPLNSAGVDPLSGDLRDVTAEQLAGLPKSVVPLARLGLDWSSSGGPLRLPKGSTRRVAGGVEEVFVPSPPRPPTTAGLVPSSVLPDYLHKAFTHTPELNRIQSTVFSSVFQGEQNVLVCAPTGAGKTTVALLSILGLINRTRHARQPSKSVVLAPMKALVGELVRTFSARLEGLARVAEYTGDSDIGSGQLEGVDVIVATPEKWDVLTRKSEEKSTIDRLGLMVIDEVHLIGDPRGAVIESLVMRSKGTVRIVGLSATLPNYKEVARFIGAESDSFFFGSEHRPVPLAQTFLGFPSAAASGGVRLIRDRLYSEVTSRIPQGPILIFVHSRRETLRVAGELLETAGVRGESSLFSGDARAAALRAALVPRLAATGVKELVAGGIGVHHAGLARGDRLIIEEMFAGRQLAALVSTATLAWGVNLPARTVIIRGTSVYSPDKGGWTQLSLQDLMQMLGRAGRPGYDSEGDGVIITESQEIRRYLALAGNAAPLESQLAPQLPQMLSAEIVLGRVEDLKEALEWIDASFLAIRLRAIEAKETKGGSVGTSKAEGFVAATGGEGVLGTEGGAMASKNVIPPATKTHSSESSIRRRMLDMLHSALLELESCGLITYDRKTGRIDSTSLGRIAAYHAIEPRTARLFWEGSASNSIDALRLFSQAAEFVRVTVREEEKPELKKLAAATPIPIKAAADSPASKVAVLLQCFVARIGLDGYALSADMAFVGQNAPRLMRAMFQIFVLRNCGGVSAVLGLARAVEQRQFPAQSPLRQFVDSPIILRKIEAQELLSWEHLLALSRQQIETLLKDPEAAEGAYRALSAFPRLEVEAAAVPVGGKKLKVSLLIRAQPLNTSTPLWVFLTDLTGEKLLFARPVELRPEEAPKPISFEAELPMPLQSYCFLNIVHDRLFGVEVNVPLALSGLRLPTNPSTPQPLNASTPQHLNPSTPQPLRLPRAAAAFLSTLGFSGLTAYQQEVLGPALALGRDASLLLSAPGRSGKFVIGLCALAESLASSPSARVLILFDSSATLASKSPLLSEFFSFAGSGYFLKGSNRTDRAQLSQARVLAAAAGDFRRASFGRPRLDFTAVLICGVEKLTESPALEAAVTRLRAAGAAAGTPRRWVGATGVVGDVDSLAAWLGVEKSKVFAAPGVRNAGLAVKVAAVSFGSRAGEAAAGLRKASRLLADFVQTGGSAAAIVATKAEATRLGLETLKRLGGKGVAAEEARPLLREMRELFGDFVVGELLESGVGCLTGGQSEAEQSAIVGAFNRGVLRLLVATSGVESALSGSTPDGVLLLVPEGVDSIRLSWAAGLLNSLPEIDLESPLERPLFVVTPQWAAAGAVAAASEMWLVESPLLENLADFLVAEIASGVAGSKQDCLDLLSFSFLFHRLRENPSFYGLADPAGVAAFLSSRVDSALEELSSLGCVESTDEGLESRPLAAISAFHGILPASAAHLAASTANLRGWRRLFSLLLEIDEFGAPFDAPGLRARAAELEFAAPLDWETSNACVFVLLQLYLQREDLGDLAIQMPNILSSVRRVLAALVDVCAALATPGTLTPTLLALRMGQCLAVQVSPSASPLLQFPGFGPTEIAAATGRGVSSPNEFLSADEETRAEIIKALSDTQIAKVAEFANRFPVVSAEASVVSIAEDEVKLAVSIEKEGDPEVDSESKGWWLIVAEGDSCLVAKKIEAFESRVDREINVPLSEGIKGRIELKIFVVSEYYIGADEEKGGIVVEIPEST